MTPRVPRMLSAEAAAWLQKVQGWTAELSGTERTTTFGNPTFKVSGRAFLVLDHYRGADCLWFRVRNEDRFDRLAQSGWFASPYDPKRQALCIALNAIDGRKIRSWIRGSYAIVCRETSRTDQRTPRPKP
jgi:ATP-dependent phosphoenolpyruvate carboxykinase